jgi:hypothetical protein
VALQFGLAEVRGDTSRALVLAVCSAPALLLALPWVGLLEVALTLRMVAAAVGLLALIALLLAPQFELLVATWGWRVPAALALVTLGLGSWALLSPEYDEVRKRPNNLVYLSDLDTGEAYWGSRDPTVDEWTARVLGETPVREALPQFGFPRPMLLLPVTSLPTAEPTLTVLATRDEGEQRVIDIRVAMPPGTFQTVIDALAGSAALPTFTLNERWHFEPRSATNGPTRLLSFIGAPPDGLTLRLTLPADETLTLRVRTIVPGWPTPLAPRPDDTMSRGSDVSVLQRSFVVGQ